MTRPESDGVHFFSLGFEPGTQHNARDMVLCQQSTDYWIFSNIYSAGMDVIFIVSNPR
jgi:hypothetical protein